MVNLWKKLNVEYGKIVSKKNKGVLIVKKAIMAQLSRQKFDVFIMN